MIEDSGRFTRAEKEALLEKLKENQIPAAAWSAVNRINDRKFTCDIVDIIADLEEEAWIRINDPTLEKEKNPEGFVMNGVRWKAIQLGKDFCDQRHAENVAKKSLVRDQIEEEQYFENEINYRDSEICKELRRLGNKEDGVRCCIEKGFRTSAGIREVFIRCELNSKGIDDLLAKNMKEKVGWQPTAHSVTKELFDKGITDITEVSKELDRRNITYRPSRVLDYLRKFAKEKRDA